jgi:hypothetical protein
MAALVLRIKETQNREREIAAKKIKEDAAVAKDVLMRFSRSKSKTLNYEELRSWLKSVAHSQTTICTIHARKELDVAFPGSSKALSTLNINSRQSIPALSDGEADIVRDDEVDWVIMMAINKNDCGQVKKSDTSHLMNLKETELQPSEFGGALQAWLSYVHNKATLQRVMKTYGTNDRGQMERSHVKSMLKDLSDGREPEESEVDWVMDEARAMPHSNGISGPELIKVLSLWYIKDLEKEEQAQSVQVAHAGHGCSATCCVS